jgi:hypothetical protein
MADVTRDILFLVHKHLLYVEFYARHESKRGAMAVSSRVHPYSIAGASTVQGRSDIEGSF